MVIPLASYSAMAGNPLILNPDRPKDEGLLAEEDEADPPAFPVEKVDFEQVVQTKIPAKESLREL